MNLLHPSKKSLIYEDDLVYACLASFPIVNGHTVVVWKRKAPDLSVLKLKEYEYLMDAVDKVRNALLKALNLEKVYLLYMDEVNQVHWHLIPRYNERGYNLFRHKPQRTNDFSIAEKIRKNLK